jgi:hypothetical protein
MPNLLSIVATLRDVELIFFFIKEASVARVNGNPSQVSCRNCHYLVMELNNGQATK